MDSSLSSPSVKFESPWNMTQHYSISSAEGWSDFEEKLVYTSHFVPNCCTVGPQFQNMYRILLLLFNFSQNLREVT